jgi:hypothetical protein
MNALLLGCLCLGSFLPVHAQDARPPVKSSIVVVQTPDSAAVALRKVATALVAQGYTVDKLDTQFCTLLMAPKAMAQQYNPVLTVRAAASPGTNSVIKISGDYKVDYGNTHFTTRAEYAGSETGNNKTAFRELQKAAVAAYPSGQLSYIKQ